MISRRAVLAGAALAAIPAVPDRVLADVGGLEPRFAALEAKIGGRLGVTVIDTATGASTGRRGGERFAMCSTFKFLATAAVLAAVDKGGESLDRRVRIPKTSLVTWSPVTEKHADGPGGMSLRDICAAAMTTSDNTAANIILETLGGPDRLTAYIRTLGDEVSRADRYELDLNKVAPGNPRDTTTPLAMARNLQKVVLGDALSPASRQQMVDWLIANQTGDARLRAGFPVGWRVGDKTGTNNDGATNDIAVAWPPSRAPIIIAAYVHAPGIAGQEREAALKDVGSLVAQSIDS